VLWNHCGLLHVNKTVILNPEPLQCFLHTTEADLFGGGAGGGRPSSLQYVSEFLEFGNTFELTVKTIEKRGDVPSFSKFWIHPLYNFTLQHPVRTRYSHFKGFQFSRIFLCIQIHVGADICWIENYVIKNAKIWFQNGGCVYNQEIRNNEILTILYFTFILDKKKCMIWLEMWRIMHGF
jgi:hypothetical protein